MSEREQSVLIVDDTAEARAVLARILSEFRPVSAGSAAEALAILEAGAEPDLFLLDVVMPGVDGYALCRTLKADDRWRDTPVIFITGFGDKEHEAAAFELGAVDYVAKPLDPAVIRARVRTHLALQAAKETIVRQNLTLEHQVAIRTVELEAALQQVRQVSLETIIRLSWAAEYKDEDTGEHVLRLSYYSEAIARRLGLPEDEVEALLRAAPMHDIGKIGVPDRVLLKPGPLDAGEWELMMQHTTIGARILSGSVSEAIKLAGVIALSHHENWDGSGYPQGLRGEEIPLAARIVSVADTFDALMSKRPYKQPCSLEASLEVVRGLRGGKLAPAVVDAFLAIEGEIVEICATYQDREVSPLAKLLGGPWLRGAAPGSTSPPLASDQKPQP